MRKLFCALLVTGAVLFLCGCGMSVQTEPSVTSTPRPTATPEVLTAYILIPEGDSVSESYADNFSDYLESLGGKAVLQTYSGQVPSFTSYLKEAEQAGADLIYAPVPVSDGVNLLRQAQNNDIAIPVFSWSEWDCDELRQALPGTGFDVYCTSFFDSSGDSGESGEFVKGFGQWLLQKDPTLAINGGTTTPAPETMTAYDAYNLIVRAIAFAADKKGTELTSSDVNQAISNMEYSGVTGTFRFDESGNACRSSFYIRKEGDVSSIFVKTVSLPGDESSSGFNEVNNEDAIVLDSSRRLIRIGVADTLGDIKSSAAPKELLGLLYANSLCPKLTIGEKEYTIELIYPASAEQSGEDLIKRFLSKRTLAVIGNLTGEDAGSKSDVATLGQSAIPVVSPGKEKQEDTEDTDGYYRIWEGNPREGAAMAAFAFELLR